MSKLDEVRMVWGNFKATQLALLDTSFPAGKLAQGLERAARSRLKLPAGDRVCYLPLHDTF
ncbi:MAG TPA: hypothetical protein VNY29_03215 [Terriglobales bacterium]|nr:hypothetical protein [Terriglobales bacterium]